MTPEDLLDAALQSGVSVRVKDGALLVSGAGSAPMDLIDELREKVNDVMGLLSCARCGATGVRLIRAYWGSRFCPPCCAGVVEENDAADNWPPTAPEGWQ